MSSWGAEKPDFLLTSGKLCFQLTMTQERTQYLSRGDDGNNILKDGPMMDKYRGLSIVKSRAFSMEEGAAPRDVLRRRVRTSEFYFGAAKELESVDLYDEASDNFVPLQQTKLATAWNQVRGRQAKWKHFDSNPDGADVSNVVTYLLIRPFIEHYMLGMIIGCGGMEKLGATLW